MLYPEKNTYTARLEKDARLPEGFKTAVAELDFVPAEKPESGNQKMNLALLSLDKPTTSFGGVFTKNIFPGWPVIAGRSLLDEKMSAGVLVNNRVANVAVPGGLEDALEITGELQRQKGMADMAGESPQAPYFPSSTGVIGWGLPAREIKKTIPRLLGGLQGKTILPFARAIMTTDSWPKIRSAELGGGRITAVAKGAGMIEPGMATMLSFFLTDLDVPRDYARDVLKRVMENTFNRISVDGEMSTSDTVLFFSSGTKPFPGKKIFEDAMYGAAALLSEDVVRNGEGTAHVFRINISGAPDTDTAVYLARSMANAPLTKTAIKGNDPNTGRILQALGAACGRKGIHPAAERINIKIGPETVYEGGHLYMNDKKEKSLSAYLKECEMPLPAPGWPVHEKTVEIHVDIAHGNSCATVTASDLSEEYIHINADYRS